MHLTRNDDSRFSVTPVRSEKLRYGPCFVLVCFPEFLNRTSCALIVIPLTSARYLFVVRSVSRQTWVREELKQIMLVVIRPDECVGTIAPSTALADLGNYFLVTLTRKRWRNGQWRTALIIGTKNRGNEDRYMLLDLAIHIPNK